MPTDKSKKLTVSKPDNYVELMEPHLRNDPLVTMSEQDSMERLLTDHAIQWGRILKMGGKWDDGGGRHWVRVKSALATKNTLHVRPPLHVYGLPKNHKPPNSRDGNMIGHPLRPVCGATESMK